MLSSLFIKFIFKIIDAVKVIVKGDYNVKIDVKNKDEIGEFVKIIIFMV